MRQNHAIVVDGLTKQFGDHVAVDNASFTVPYGSVTGFIGGNGSGKTTSMRMILGLTKPSAGSCLVNGDQYQNLNNPRQLVGSVLDRLGGHPGLNAQQHLRMIAASAGISPDTIPTALELVGLTNVTGRKLGKYSTGMKQRLALAGALLADPQILILDEPASGLDPAGIRWLRTLLRAKATDGVAVFVSTHQLAELAAIVDHVVVIHEGKVLATEPAPVLLDRTQQTKLEEAVFALTTS